MKSDELDRKELFKYLEEAFMEGRHYLHRQDYSPKDLKEKEDRLWQAHKQIVAILEYPDVQPDRQMKKHMAKKATSQEIREALKITKKDERVVKEIIKKTNRGIPKVSDEFIEKAVERLEDSTESANHEGYVQMINPKVLKQIFKEAGYQTEAKPTEEWIEEKAGELFRLCNFTISLEEAEGFIRSLVEENK